MAQFPKSEAEILMLAQAIVNGLETNATVYPAPPVTFTNLSTALDAYVVAKDIATTAQATAQAAIGTKDAVLQTLVDDMKADLRYAETKVNFDDAKLKLLGWGGRTAAVALTPPGQTRTLEAPRQGEGWIFLDWKEPVDGGAVATYKIQRRLRPDGAWTDVGLAIDSETTLTAQERNKEWEYRVSAVNKAGEGAPSNTVMAVL